MDDFVEMMECPICLETPRTAPIFNCANGHVVCNTCLPKTNSCPVCRNSKIDCRNLIAEKLLEKSMSEGVIKCRNNTFGCTFRNFMGGLAQHEALCVYRTVTCPGRRRGGCMWTGQLHTLTRHELEKQCVKIIRMDSEKRTYSSVISNFGQDDLTVFGRPNATHWRPVMLHSSDHLRLFAYLVVYRNQKGEWFFYVRSYAEREALDKWEVKVTVRRPPSTLPIKHPGTESAEATTSSTTTTTTAPEEQEGPSWSFEGHFVSHEASEEDVQNSGQFLVLGDDQVKGIVVDKVLLQYVVKISEKKKKD